MAPTGAEFEGSEGFADFIADGVYGLIMGEGDGRVWDGGVLAGLEFEEGGGVVGEERGGAGG